MDTDNDITSHYDNRNVMMEEIHDNDGDVLLTRNHPSLFIFLFLSCTLSLIGSISILSYILRNNKHQPQPNATNGSPNTSTVYHRIVLGMSVADCIGTLGYSTAVFMVPRATHLAWALGNATTCRISGMLQIFVMSPFLYNAELAVYCWWLLWRKQTTNATTTTTTSNAPPSQAQQPGSQRQHWWESLYIHFIPLTSAIALAIVAGPVLDVIHPDTLTGLCDLGPNPPTCAAPDCGNGQSVHLLFQTLTILLSTAVLIGIVATWHVRLMVRQQASSSAVGRLALPPTTTTTTTERRQHDMTVQAFLYTLLFSLMIIIIGYANAWRSVADWSATRILWHRCIFHVVAPAQGLGNALIYFRLRWRQWRTTYPSRSWWWVVRQTVRGGTPGAGPSLSSSSSSSRVVGLSKRMSRSDDRASSEEQRPVLSVTETTTAAPAHHETTAADEERVGDVDPTTTTLPPDEADFYPSSCHSDDDPIIRIACE